MLLDEAPLFRQQVQKNFVRKQNLGTVILVRHFFKSVETTKMNFIRATPLSKIAMLLMSVKLNIFISVVVK
jgi:hypothetical protein